MANWYQDNTQSIGRTPLVRVSRVLPVGGARVLAKLEARNPAYSVKCRVGAALVWDAERRGVLAPGREIVEPTSGNTGVALALVAATRGYPLTLTMPEGVSHERRKLCEAYGARLLFTPRAGGMALAVARAEEIQRSDPSRYVLLQQFKNPANPGIHESTTGPEIWADTDGDVDVFVSAVGTGGTITGVSRYFERARNKAIHSVAVEPAESPVLAQHRAGQVLRPGAHRIQGIGAGFVPEILDMSLIDDVAHVSGDEALEWAGRLTRTEGILAGVSSGAAMCVAARLAALPEYEQKTIVVLFPDSGERYLSTAMFDAPPRAVSA